MPSGAGTAAWPRSKAVPSPWLHPARTPRRSEPPASGCSERRGRTGAWAPSARSPIDLLAERTQHLQLDQILRPTGRPLHGHEVVKTRDQDDPAHDLGRQRTLSELVEVEARIGMGQQIEIAMARRQRHDVRGPERSPVELSPHLLGRTAANGGQFAEDRREAVEVVAVDG